MRKLVILGSEVISIAALASTLVLAGLLVVPSPASAAVSPVQLGTAENYSVLGGTGIVSTGDTVLNADLGVSPSSSITGFLPSFPGVVDGVTQAGDSQAAQAQSDLVVAYGAAAGLTPSGTFSGDQNGKTYDAGVYSTGAAFALTGTMTLNGQGNPNAVFIFQINAALNTAAASAVILTGGAQASNVFWQVNGAAGTGANSSFIGTIMAAGAITVGAGGSIDGRALSYGIVTLADNIVTTPDTVTFASPPTPASALTTTTADTVAATGTPGDGGVITYTSNTPSICSVGSSSGALTFVTSGTCTIQASQAADAADSDALTITTTSIAVTTPLAYVVTFNGNGSTGGSTAAETANTPTALTANGFSRTGDAFSGWNTAANGTGTAYADGASYSFSAAGTLYAQWTVDPAYAVTFNGNGSTGGSTAAETANTPTALNANGFSRTGDAFSGWNTAANGTGTAYADGASYSFSAAGTLYAQWTSTFVTLIQGGPTSATVAGGDGYSGQGGVTNANGTVTYTETVSPDSTDVVVSSTGAIGATTSLAAGTYQVRGDDSDLSGDTGTWLFALTVTPLANPVGGYDLVGSDGGVFAFGGAPFLGSLPGIGVHVKDIVGMVPTNNDGGYWLAGADGGVFAFGNAPFLGSLPGIGVHVHDIVGIVPTADDLGYFLVGRDGGVFAFGNAPFIGSLPGRATDVDDIVGIATTPDDQGYWMVESSGQVYAFGVATQLGSAPGAVTSISSTPAGEGYWLTGADGGIFAFGDAPFDGSLPGIGVKVHNIVSMVPSTDGKGYLLIGADGGIFAFGDAPFEGSLPGMGVHVVNIVGAVPTAAG